MTDNSLIFLSKNGSEIEPCKKEAFRYMNCKADYKSEELEKLYEECLYLNSLLKFYTRRSYRKH